MLVELCGSNAAKEQNRTCTPCVEGLSCPTGSTVDMLRTAESMVQTKLLEGTKRVFEIHENTNLRPQLLPVHLSTSYPQSSSVRLKEIILYIQVLANRAVDACSISCPGSYWIKPLRNWIHEMVKHPFSANGSFPWSFLRN